MIRSAVVVTAVFALAACQEDDANPARTGTDPVEQRQDDPGLTERIAPLVQGHYAVLSDVVTDQDLPFFGRKQITSRTLGLGEIQREGAGFVFVETSCRVETSGVEEVRTVIPDAVPRSLPAQRSQLVFTERDDVLSWERPESLFVVGAELADPQRDRLPTESTDDRLRDPDRDGNPGVTVRIEGVAQGDIYVVERRRVAYRGTMLGAGQLQGLVLDRSERSVVGASVEILRAPIPTMPHEEGRANHIRLQRIDGPRDCDRLVTENGPLYP